MKNSAKNHLKAKRYFIVTGVLTLFWLLLFVRSQPQWMQTIKERLGLSPILQASQDSFYHSRIAQIFDKYCTACHDSNKAKGHLRLDSFRQLTFSGRSGSNLTMAENNLLVERMSLPKNDRLAMPPYGRERHTEEELAILKLWLSKGGSGVMTESDFPEAPAKAKVIKFAEIDWHHIAELRKPNQQQVSHLQQQFPNVLHYLARTSHLLTLDGSLMPTEFNDSHLAQFQLVAPDIATLNLTNTNITDKSAQFITSLSALESIKLVGTKVNAELLLALLNQPNLKQVFADAAMINSAIASQYAAKNIALYAVQGDNE